MTRRFWMAIPFAGLIFLGGFWFGSVAGSTVHAQSTPMPIYELRTYHTYDGKLDALLSRFRDHTTAIFERHGIHNVAYWTPEDEPLKGKTLIYVIAHPSREEAKKNWAAFSADPEWVKVRTASEANGKIVEKVDSVYMDPTDFSPLK